MINKTKYLLYTLLILINYRCTEKECSYQSIIPISKEKALLKRIDSCKDYVAFEGEYFYIYKDTLLPNGFYKEYYPNGKIKEFRFYKMNRPDSLWFKFYPDGKKKSEYFYAEGEVSGPQYTYYKNGNIKSAVFYKNDSTWWFSVDYSNEGKVTTTKGSTIHIITKPGFELRKVGEKLVLLNMVSQYKNTHAILNIKLEKGQHLLLDTTVTKFSTVINKPYFGFVHTFNNPGNYNYTAIVRLFDSQNGSLIKEDSLKSLIKVK